MNVNYSFTGFGFVGINILWKRWGINLVNVYAPGSAVARRELWNSLLERKNIFANEVWCLGGDFNEIMHKDERRGEEGYYSRRGMEDFRSFICHMDLVDIRCLGGKYRWFKDNRTTMSRLDRFLVLKNLLDVWEVVDQRIGMREISDHAPISLNFDALNWGQSRSISILFGSRTKISRILCKLNGLRFWFMEGGLCFV